MGQERPGAEAGGAIRREQQRVVAQVVGAWDEEAQQGEGGRRSSSEKGGGRRAYLQVSATVQMIAVKGEAAAAAAAIKPGGEGRGGVPVCGSGPIPGFFFFLSDQTRCWAFFYLQVDLHRQGPGQAHKSQKWVTDEAHIQSTKFNKSATLA